MVTWKSRQHLQQQPLDLDVGLVDLVDQQHRRLLAPDRGQQRAGQQELVGEDVVVGLVPRLVAAARPGCGAAASCSSTRTAPAPRRGPRSTAAGPGRRRSRARPPWPARSCRPRPDPRPAAASRARPRGTPWSRWPGRPGSRRRAAGSPRRRARRTRSSAHPRARRTDGSGGVTDLAGARDLLRRHAAAPRRTSRRSARSRSSSSGPTAGRSTRGRGWAATGTSTPTTYAGCSTGCASSTYRWRSSGCTT